MKRAAFLLLLLFTLPAQSAPARIDWLHDINEAISQAQKKSKPIFVDAYADWCAWCHKLDREVYSDPRFVIYMEQFIPVRIDIEDNGSGSRYAEQNEINDLPTLLVLDSNGHTTNRISGFLSADELMADVDHMQHLLEREEKDPNDLSATYQLANEYLAREMNHEAEEHFQKIVGASGATVAQKESATFSLALTQFYQQHYQPAIATLKTYEEVFKDGASGEDALLLLCEIELDLNSNDQARLYLQEFLRRYPKSENADRAQQMLSTLKGDAE
jgi:TolA-binding protein